MLLKKMDKWLLLITVALFAFGLVMIFSASNVTAYMRYLASPYKYMIRQAIILLIGLVSSLFLVRLSSKQYGVLSWPGLLGCTILLVIVLLYGKTTNSATSWINLGLFQLQPSEFAKVLMILWMSSFYQLNKNKMSNYITAFTPIVFAGIITGLIIIQPDLGTAIIFGSIVFFLFLASPTDKNIKLRTIFITLIVGLIGIIIIISGGGNVLSDRQSSRLDFLNPCSEEKFYSDGNQVCNAFIAINNGGLFGKGLGNSTQKYLYLPEAHTDFIFAIVVEELGFVVSSVIILLMMFVIYRIIYIGKKSNSIRGRMTCYGVAFYIFMHILVNLAGILGLMPMTGVPLPFFSYGGSFALSLIFSLILVQRVAIENNSKKN